MKPIINPWLVYIAEKCETVGEICEIIGVVGIFLCVVWWVLHLIGEFDIKVPKWLVTISVIGAIFAALLPSQKTILTMATLQYITPNNVTVVGETAEDVIDYITEKIEEIIDEED